MSNTDWKESFRDQLTLRDKREKQLDSIIFSFKATADRCVKAEGNVYGDSSDEEEGRDRTKSEGNDEMSKLNNQLSAKMDALKKAKEDLKQLTYRYTELKSETETTKESLRRYERESVRLNHTVQNLNDEILALQIQLNVSEENNKKLTEENSALVDRWIKRVEGEASKMNEANEFLQSLDRKKQAKDK